MKKLIFISAVIFLIVWVYVIFLNYPKTSYFIIPFVKEEITVNTSWLLLSFGIFTGIIDSLFALWFFKSKTELNKNYQIKMDKLSVQSDSDKSQVKILENKIKTLEAVIEKLTKEKNG